MVGRDNTERSNQWHSTEFDHDCDDISLSDLEGPKIDRRTTMKLLGAAGLTGGLSGMASADSSDAATGTAVDADSEAAAQQQGGSIDAAWAIDRIVTLDPHYSDLWQQITIFANIFSGITKLNGKGEIVGDIATDWSLPDSTTYEFSLRDDAVFHDGTQITAEEVRASIERLQNLDDSPHQGKVDPISNIDVPDATTMRISLKEPTAPFIAFLTRGPGRAGTVVNTSAIDEMGQQNYAQQPVGSGPFQIGSRSVGESITLQAFDDYYETWNGNQLPMLDEVTINLIPEPTTLWTAFQNGEVKYADELPPQNARVGQQSPRFDVVGTNAGEWSSISMLCNKPQSGNWPQRIRWVTDHGPTDYWQDRELPTTNKTVRKAITKAINRQELVEKAHFGFARPARSLFNPAINWAYEENPENGQQFAPEEARSLLDEAGYTGSPRFSGRILGTPTDERLMTVVQQQLSNVGIEVSLDVQQESSFWTSIYQYEHMFQVYGGGGDIDPWMSWWKQLKTPVQEGTSGTWQKNLYSNEEFDKLLEQSYRTPNQEERRQYVKEAEQIFLEDAPFAMTTFPLTPKGTTGNLTNVRNPVGMSNFHAAHLDN